MVQNPSPRSPKEVSFRIHLLSVVLACLFDNVYQDTPIHNSLEFFYTGKTSPKKSSPKKSIKNKKKKVITQGCIEGGGEGVSPSFCPLGFGVEVVSLVLNSYILCT